MINQQQVMLGHTRMKNCGFLRVNCQQVALLLAVKPGFRIILFIFIFILVSQDNYLEIKSENLKTDGSQMEFILKPGFRIILFIFSISR